MYAPTETEQVAAAQDEIWQIAQQILAEYLKTSLSGTEGAGRALVSFFPAVRAAMGRQEVDGVGEGDEMRSAVTDMVRITRTSQLCACLSVSVCACLLVSVCVLVCL